MNQVSFSIQDTLLHIGEIPSDLAHPQSVRHLRDARDLHLPRRQVDEEQNDKPLQSSPGPRFHGEEVGGHKQLPMPAQKLLPRRLPAPLRRRLDSVPLQDLRDRAAGNLVPQVGQRALDAPISPVPVLFSHSHEQLLGLLGRASPSQPALSTAVVLLGNQFPMPGQSLA